MAVTSIASPPRRTTAHAAAAVLNVVVAVLSIGFALPSLFDGAATTAASGDQPPYAIIIVSFVLGIAGFISSWGVWQGQRWGVILTIVINALQFLSGAPGIAFGPTTFLVVGSVVGCVLNAVIVYLLLRRGGARRAGEGAVS